MLSFVSILIAINIVAALSQTHPTRCQVSSVAEHTFNSDVRKCATQTDETAIAIAEKSFQIDRVSAGLHVRSIRVPVELNVHWHVIRKNETQEGGDIWDFVVNGSIDVLNYHFKDSGIHWNLVNVSRVTNEDWFLGVGPNSTAEFEMKRALRQGGSADLNIYSVRNEYASSFGWATFPYEWPLNPEWMDGVVIRDTTVPGGTAEGMNRGKTLVHEVGHWCGLYHVFMNDCNEPGDYVDDTPPQEAQYNCFVPRRSACMKGEWDPLFNIMDYTGDCCQKDFTPGQNQRMREQLKVYRGVDA